MRIAQVLGLSVAINFMTIHEFKFQAKNLLTNSPSAALDIEIFLSHFLGLSKTQILMKAKDEIPGDQLALLHDAIARRLSGLPVAYITGHKEFYGYDYMVTPAVLIPKPDTEILVEKAIIFLEEKIAANPDRILTVCDMCTGSGCIGLSVLKALSEEKKIPSERLPKFTLVDISAPALEVARKNADSLLSGEKVPYSGMEASPSAPATTKSKLRERVRFVQSNLFEMLPYQFDVVLTNPPYIPASLTEKLLRDGRSEPRLALDGDVTLTGDKSDSDDGLEIIRNLMPQLGEHVAPGGFFLMETGEYNMRGAENLSYRAGFRNSQVFQDLEGQERVLYGEKK